MTPFFLRELRRMAAPGLALVGLAALMLVLLVAGSQLTRGAPVQFDLIYVAACCVAPWLLGTAAFAPDMENGAEAFLRVLPASRAKLLLARLAAALFWTGLVVAAAWGAMQGAYLLTDGTPAADTGKAYWVGFVLGSVGFLAGAVSATILRRSLLAFVLAPVLVGAPLTLHNGLCQVLGAPGDYVLLGWAALLPALIGVGVWSYLRIPVQAGVVPALRAAGGVTLVVLLVCGGFTTAAYAYDRASAPLQFRYLHRSLNAQEGWLSLSTNTIWRYYRGSRFIHLGAAEKGRTHPRIREGHPLAVSPSGKTLLVWRWQRGTVELVALGTDAILGSCRYADSPFGGAQTRLASRQRLVVRGGTLGRGWIWRGDEPFRVVHLTAVSWDGDECVTIPGSPRAITAQGGSRLVVKDAEGRLHLWDIARPAQLQQLQLPDGTAPHATALGPRGQLLVMTSVAESGELSVWCQELDVPEAAPRRVELPASDRSTWLAGERLRTQQVRVHFGSAGQRFLLERESWLEVPRESTRSLRRRIPARVFAIERETLRVLPLGQGEDWDLDAVAWSPHDERILTTAGCFDLNDGRRLDGGQLNLHPRTLERTLFDGWDHVWRVDAERLVRLAVEDGRVLDTQGLLE